MNEKTTENKQRIKCDSLIFDMDGTLWDAVDSYVTIWNHNFANFGITGVTVTREMLLEQMGRHLEDILVTLCPVDPPQGLMEAVEENERLMMPKLGGKLYPRVRETLTALKDAGFKLFLVSNCGEHGLDNFVNSNGFEHLFTDHLSHGGTGLPKDENIRLLIDKYGLNAVYVGDTAGDSEAAARAGVPMIWCAYGFGHNVPCQARIDAFTELPGVVELIR